MFFTVLAELGTLKSLSLHLYAFLLAAQWDALELETKKWEGCQKLPGKKLN